MVTLSVPFRVPATVISRDGPFDEFANNAAIISVELDDGRKIPHVLLIAPDQIGAIKGYDEMPFDPSRIVRAFQTSEDLKVRSSSTWKFWL